MLACARIGAVHSVIFGGFSSEAIADRNNDARAKLVITADGGWRRGQQIAAQGQRRRGPAKIAHRRASASCSAAAGQRRSHAAGPRFLVARSDGTTPRPIARPSRSIAKRRCSSSTPAARPANPRASSTPRPATTCTPRRRPSGSSTYRDEDVYWCTADCGWVTGHSYVVYGPLSAGATVLMYEGAPNWPHEGRFWEMIEKYRVSDLLHRAHRHPRLHQVGRRTGSTSTISRACGCWARSARGSTPRPGCGITARSAASAARSSIPGGRPKRAAS